MEWERYPTAADAGEHTVVGTVRVLREVQSPELENVRDVLAYLPPSYDAGEGRYPVIYMHDGQNLFDAATSFGEEWRVDETMEALAAEGIEAIVVAVPNTGVERCEEYSPFQDPSKGGGYGDEYLKFLTGTVKPIVDRDFRTLPGREHTGMIGSSMGGLITLYGFFREPDFFGFAGVLSPSLWFAERAVFPFVEKADFVPGRIHLDVGTAEGEETVADARRMREVLEAKGYTPGSTLSYHEAEGAGHAEGAWAERLGGVLRFLLGPAD